MICIIPNGKDFDVEGEIEESYTSNGPEGSQIHLSQTLSI
jgi:hypothetical protein